jgi:hypothetical protein
MVHPAHQTGKKTMNIDSEEMQQVAAAAAPRVDMYAGIHKALRALHGRHLAGLGRMDAATTTWSWPSTTGA